MRFELTGPTARPSAVRLLNREGALVGSQLVVAADDTRQSVSASMPLAPLAAGLYVVEWTRPDGSAAYIAFRLAV